MENTVTPFFFFLAGIHNQTSIINPHTEAGLTLLSLFHSSLLRHFIASSFRHFVASSLQQLRHCVASSLQHCVASSLQHHVASSLQHRVASSWLRGFFASTLRRLFVSTLRRCVASSLQHYVVSSLQHFVASSLWHCVASSSCNSYLSTIAVLLCDRHLFWSCPLCFAIFFMKVHFLFFFYSFFLFVVHFSGVHPVLLFIVVLRLFTHNGCFCRLFEDSQESVHHHTESRGQTHRGGDNFGSSSFCQFHLFFVSHRC